jgi:hypothetical protein
MRKAGRGRGAVMIASCRALEKISKPFQGLPGHGDIVTVSRPVHDSGNFFAYCFRGTGRGQGMAHDVFISYSSKDKPTADATCAILEGKGIRCWIAPRDILPSADWGEAIIDAIGGARVFVLVFSSNANASPQIKREVERAINRGIPVVPFRIENVAPTKSLEYFLSTPHWLDAFSPPLEQHLNYLATVISNILKGATGPAPPPPPPPPPVDDTPNRRRIVAGGGAAALAAAAGGYFLFGRPRPETFTGSWTAQNIDFGPDVPSPFAAFSINSFYQAALAAKKVHGDFSLDEAADYRFGWGGEDTGIVAYGGNSAIFTSDLTKQSTTFTFAVLPTAPANIVAFLGGRDGQAAISLARPGIGLSMLVGASQGTGLTGAWMTSTAATPVFDATRTSLDVTAQGRYRYKFAFSESGTFHAANGVWTRIRQGAQPQSGNYKFDGPDQVSAGGDGITFVWRRTG